MWYKPSMLVRVLCVGLVLSLVAADGERSVPTDCSTEAVRVFNGKVHVILQNACLNCHVAEKTSFQLRRGDSASNLAAALKQVDRKQPNASPLLRRAVEAHGKMTRPPFKDANAPAYKHLEAWVKLVAHPSADEAKSEHEKDDPAANELPFREARDPFDSEIFNRFAH
jgi:hypothetical protein